MASATDLPAIPTVTSCSAGVTATVDQLITANPDGAIQLLLFVHRSSIQGGDALLYDLAVCDPAGASRLLSYGMANAEYAGPLSDLVNSTIQQYPAAGATIKSNLGV